MTVAEQEEFNALKEQVLNFKSKFNVLHREFNMQVRQKTENIELENRRLRYVLRQVMKCDNIEDLNVLKVRIEKIFKERTS